MRKVTTYSGLLRELERIRDTALVGVGEDVVELAKKHVDDDVYKKYTPVKYERTYQLRDSLFSEKLQRSGNSASVVVRHDWQDMSHNVEKYQHASPFWSPWVYNRYLAETVEFGLSGDLFGKGAWQNPRPYMANTKADLINGEYRRFMVRRLMSMGYKAL